MSGFRKSKLLRNIFFSIIDRGILVGGQVFITLVTLRNLSPETIGIIGKISGLQVLIQFLNPTLESSMFRLTPEEINSPGLALTTLVLNLLKWLLFTCLGFLLIYLQSGPNIIEYLAYGGISLIIASETVHGCMTFFSTIKYRHHSAAKISFYRMIFNCLTVTFLLSSPDMTTYCLKELANFLFLLLLWGITLRAESWQKKNGQSKTGYINLIKLILHNFKNQGIWNHLVSASTQIIYRVDTYILSMFSPLSTVGKYNISLNAANTLATISGIVSTQNNVSLHHLKDEKLIEQVHSKFVRAHIYLFVAWLGGSFLFAEVILKLFSGQNFGQEMVEYFLWISTGLALIKTLSMPFVSLIQNKGELRSYFFKVIAPVLVLAPALYLIFAKFGGARGLAMSNVLIFSIWFVFTLVFYRIYFAKYKIDFNLKDDLKTLQKIIGRGGINERFNK